MPDQLTRRHFVMLVGASSIALLSEACAGGVAPAAPTAGSVSAQVLQAGYQKIGLNVTLESVPAADSFARVKDGKTNWTTTNWASRADPDGLLRILWHSTGFQNTTHFSNPEVDRLLDQAAGIFDTGQAASIYHQVEQIVVDEASYTFMLWPSEFAARRSNVQGFVYYPDLILRLRDLSLAA